MSGDGPAPAHGRLHAGLRRHGLSRRPAPVREWVAEPGLRFTEGNRVELFHWGRPALQAMLGAIESARQRIHLETYILRSDRTGRRFLAALTDRAREGVEVRLLYDGFGSLGIDAAALAPLMAAGGEVVAFNPLRRFYPRWAPRRRDHRKLLNVDGRVAFAGGLNIGDEYWGDDPDGVSDAGWRDTHLRIEGPAVRDLEAVFLESWFRADGPHLPWHELLEGPVAGSGDLGASVPGPRAAGEVRCAVVPDGPTYRRRRMRELLEAALLGASEEVRCASPYFAPGRRMLRALGEAAARQVRVELVLAGRTDHPILRRAAHAFLPRLLGHGVRVFEYDRVIMHAKVALFDRRFAIVGSSNLDRQSLEHSYEVNLVLEGGDVAERLGERFDLDLRDCRVLDALTLAQRSWSERLLDRLSSIILRFV